MLTDLSTGGIQDFMDEVGMSMQPNPRPELENIDGNHKTAGTFDIMDTMKKTLHVGNKVHAALSGDPMIPLSTKGFDLFMQ